MHPGHAMQTAARSTTWSSCPRLLSRRCASVRIALNGKLRASAGGCGSAPRWC